MDFTTMYQSLFNTSNINSSNIKTDSITANNLVIKEKGTIYELESQTINTFGDLYVSGNTTLITLQASTLENALLTNTTINGLTNTLTNIPDSSLSTLYVKADGSRNMTGNLNITSALSNVGISLINNNSTTSWNIYATNDNKLCIKDSDNNPSITLDNDNDIVVVSGDFQANNIITPTIHADELILSSPLPMVSGGSGSAVINAGYVKSNGSLK